MTTTPHHAAYEQAVAAFNARAARFGQFGNQLDPQAYAVEADYLNRERERLLAWQQHLDAERRAAERRAAAAQVAANAGSRFWAASFRGKVGIVGLAAFAFGFIIRLMNDESGFAMFLMLAGGLLLVIWFFSGLVGGGHGGHGGHGGQLEADRVRVESMRAAAERQQAQEEYDRRVREEAEARRREAIERAQRMAQTQGDEW